MEGLFCNLFEAERAENDPFAESAPLKKAPLKKGAKLLGKTAKASAKKKAKELSVPTFGFASMEPPGNRGRGRGGGKGRGRGRGGRKSTWMESEEVKASLSGGIPIEGPPPA